MKTPNEYEAIVVLGEALQKDGTMAPILENRVIAAAELYHNKKAQKLIMSGGDPHRIGVTEAQKMREYARNLDVMDGDILEEWLSLDTAGNAYFSKSEILIPQDLRLILMLTSGYKVPRAELIFKHILGPDYTTGSYGVDHSLDPKEKGKMEKRESSLIRLTYEHFFRDAKPGDDKENLRRILERSKIYFKRSEYNSFREQIDLPTI